MMIRDLIREETKMGNEGRVESSTRWTAGPRARVPGGESTEMRAHKRGEEHTVRLKLRANGILNRP